MTKIVKFTYKNYFYFYKFKTGDRGLWLKNTFFCGGRSGFPYS